MLKYWYITIHLIVYFRCTEHVFLKLNYKLLYDYDTAMKI